ncbi:MAG: NAD(P)H-hydrate epimerase [Elusimicrobia bacterium]|nr:NAD(P)H-hydrate epimerase [Elusimicrobiota bacterium]
MGKTLLPQSYLGLRVVSACEMSEIDRRAISELGIPALHLMENAGRAVAQEAARFIEDKLHRKVGEAMATACCGRGNNGGDGLAAARHLKEMGAQVVAYVAPPGRDKGYGAEVVENLRRATAAGVLVQELGEEAVDLDVRLRSSDIAIDALLGTGSSGKPSGAAKIMIQRMMRAGKPIVAIDIPSGLHPDTGHHSGVFVTAAVTVALGLPKRGLLAPHAQKNVGELKVADIGFPKSLLEFG